MAIKLFRFALGSPAEPRSGLWRAWTHEDEVHLSVEATHADLHLIAWPTGRWRITVGADVSKWTRPKEFRPGWTRGPDLLIPASPLPVRLADKDPHAGEPLTWLPAPVAGYAAHISFLLASPRAEGSQWRPQDAPGTQGLAVLPLRTAGALHINRLDQAIEAEAPVQPLDGTTAGFEVTVSADALGHPTIRVSCVP